MNRQNYRGRRALRLLRVSSAGQAEYSIPHQDAVTAQFIAREGIELHDTVELPGVSGSIPGNRRDIAEIIERKKRGESFDLLIVLDSSRLTRAGGFHVQQIEADLEDAGIEIVYVNDPTPEGDAGDIYKFMQGWSNQQAAKKISEGATRGMMAALEDGRKLPFGRPQYGIDKLYLSPDGRKLHIIRNLADGTQQQLHPETGDVIATFGRNERTGTPAHYTKQKHERVVPIPGDPKRVAVICTMFELHYVQGRGSRYIARYLNDRGVPNASGAAWSTGVIANMLVNPIYIGWGVGRRTTKSIYNMIGRPGQGPQPSLAESKELRNRRQPLLRYRPTEDWWAREFETLSDLLPEHLQALARPKIEQKLLDQVEKKVQGTQSLDKHTQSDYILKHLLHSKQGNHPMTGRTTGRQNRYYLVSRGQSNPESGSVLKRMIPATPLEEAVLRVIEEMLLQNPNIPELMDEVVRAERKRQHPNEGELKKLEAERRKLVKQIDLYIEQVEDTADPDQEERLTLKRSRLRIVNQQLNTIRSNDRTDGLDIADQTSRLVQAFSEIGENLRKLPPAALRAVVQHFIPELVVDLETRQVEMTLALPDWVTDIERLRAAVCLGNRMACHSGTEAHTPSVVIARINCQWVLKPKCFECHRRPKAA